MAYEHPINRSLHRPRLFLGVEIPPAIFLVLPTITAGALVSTQGDPIVGISICSLAVAFYFGLRWLANYDPHMFTIFWQSYRMQRVYAPRPSATGKD